MFPDYLWIKAAHVAAVLLWTGGMFLQTAVLALVARASTLGSDMQSVVSFARTWDRRVTSPALGILWAMGLWAALSGGWLGAPWLSAKLVLVIALSALHGIQSGALRRAATNATAVGIVPWKRIAFLLCALPAIAVLAVVKPFG